MFKTQLEMMKTLVDGKKITCKGWRDDCFIYLGKEGGFLDQMNKKFIPSFSHPEWWSIYTPPKKIVFKKCKRYGLLLDNGELSDKLFNCSKDLSYEYVVTDNNKIIPIKCTYEVEVDDE